MVRLSVLFLSVGLLAMFSLSASAFDLPGVGKDKKKKKEDDAPPPPPPAAPAPPPPAAPPPAAPAAEAPAAGGQVMETSMEMTISKEGFDEMKKNKVGAFVEYSSTPAPNMTMKMRVEVVEVGDNFITTL